MYSRVEYDINIINPMEAFVYSYEIIKKYILKSCPAEPAGTY